jgi:hypothetical protein
LDRHHPTNRLTFDGDHYSASSRYLEDGISRGKGIALNGSRKKTRIPEGSQFETSSPHLPLIPDDPWSLFVPFPYSDIYSKHANLRNVSQSQILSASLCSLPGTLLKTLSGAVVDSYTPHEINPASKLSSNLPLNPQIQGSIQIGKSSTQSTTRISSDHLLYLLSSPNVDSYDRETLIDLMISYDKEEGAKAYSHATVIERNRPGSAASDVYDLPDNNSSHPLSFSQENSIDISTKDEMKKVTVMYPDGGGRTYITRSSFSIPPNSILRGNDDFNKVVGSQQALSQSPLSRNIRACSISSSPLSGSPIASWGASFKPNAGGIASSVNQSFQPLIHRASSAATQQQPSSDAPVVSGSNERGKDRLKTEPLASYKRLFTLPLQLFQKQRYGINPFHLEEGKIFMEMRTHNRRRWAHAFSSQTVETNIVSRYELNYNSLCQPAVLPLSTDYIPSIDDIRNHYTLSNYSLLAGGPYHNPESLLAEMVKQRLAQDYQIVENDCMDIKVYKRFVLSTADKETPDEHFIALSMGHRIQFLSYNPSLNYIYVHGYMSKIGVNDKDTSATYSYKLWSQYTRMFETTSQLFHQYPEPEYSWNVTDELLLGNMDHLPEASKAKRIRFSISPINPQASVTSVEEYKSSMEKFLAFLGTMCEDPNETKLEYDDTQIFTRPTVSHEPVKLWLAGGPKQPTVTSPQWVYLRCSQTYSYHRVFHFHFEWIVCVSSLLEKLVSNLFRRFATASLRIIEVPEYYCSPNLQVHPFRAPPLLKYPLVNVPFPDSVTRGILLEYPTLSVMVERLILIPDSSEWILDDHQRTNWEELGVKNSNIGTDSPNRMSLENPPSIHPEERVGASQSPSKLKVLLDESSMKIVRARIGGEESENQTKSPAKITRQRLASILTSNLNPKPSRRSSVVFDKQYMQRRGYAAIRIGANAIAVLPCSLPRVSDCTTSKEASMLVLDDFFKKYHKVALCYEIVLTLIEKSIDHL